MKIIYFGNGVRAYFCLNHLIKNNINILCVITTEDEYKREHNLINLAKENDIEYFATNSPNDLKTSLLLSKKKTRSFHLRRL